MHVASSAITFFTYHRSLEVFLDKFPLQEFFFWWGGGGGLAPPPRFFLMVRPLVIHKEKTKESDVYVCKHG